MINFPPHPLLSSPEPLPKVPPDDVPSPYSPFYMLNAGDRGIDVSSWQGYPNWEQVAASGRTFAFLKVTESVDYVNPYFAHNWLQVDETTMLLRGAYHFAQPSKNSPEDEFRWFAAHVVLSAEDIPILDLETGAGDLFGWASTWLTLCWEYFGKKALFYGGGPFMRVHNLDNEYIASLCCGLWLAAYQQSQRPPVPDGWQRLDFWQYTETANVPGVNGGCDDSIYLP